MQIFIHFLAAMSVGYALPSDFTGNSDKTLFGENSVLTKSTNLTNILDDVHFLLYTRESPETAHEIILNDLESIRNVQHAETKFIVHGFSANPNTRPTPWSIRGEYVKESDYNVIILDYSILVQAPDFFVAYANAKLAAEHSAKLIKFLVDNDKTSWDKVHLVGHSLGGHVVGQIGKWVKRLEEGAIIGRITSLDPAMPLFDVSPEEDRISPDAASFVDVIHTAANGVVGWWDPVGHVDWYPNGGRYQTGCGLDFGCGHERAGEYFAESIHSTSGFWGRECASHDHFLNGSCNAAVQAIMGEKTPHSTRGVFFLDTEPKTPFAKGPLP